MKEPGLHKKTVTRACQLADALDAQNTEADIVISPQTKAEYENCKTAWAGLVEIQDDSQKYLTYKCVTIIAPYVFMPKKTKNIHQEGNHVQK